MRTPDTPRTADTADKPADLTIRLRGICLDYRDTGEVRAYLTTMRLLGFVSAADLQARPQARLQPAI